MDTRIFEEHAQVLPQWWGRGVRGRTLVCLDAHLDLHDVSPERLERLEACTSAEDVARLAKRHHLLPDKGSAYSLEDFLYPAHRLGLIDRLVWVVPPHVETASFSQVLDQLQQTPGVTPEDLAKVRRVDGGWVEGRLMGLDIAMCNHRQLPDVPVPADSLLDIDADYFIAVPGDSLWVDPEAVFRVLEGLPLDAGPVTLSRSVDSGFTPLRYRYLPDFLAALWEGREAEADHYRSLLDLDRRLLAGEAEAGRAGCQALLERSPGCAATHHLLALAEEDPDRAREHQRESARICDAYRPTPLRSACALRNRQLPVTAARVTDLKRALFDLHEDEEDRALAHIALGLLYCAGGRPRQAAAHYGEAVRKLGHHGDLALEVATLTLERGRPEDAVPYLQAALRDDGTRSPAHLLLGVVLGQRGDLKEAIRHLESARALTPAWTEVLPMLADAYEQTGEADRAAEARRRHRDLVDRMAQLVRRLEPGPA